MLFFVVLGPVVMGVVFWMTIKSARKTGAAIEVYAAELGLHAEKKPPVLGIFHPLPQVVGTLHGRDIKIYQFQKGSGKNSQTWSALEMGRVKGTDLQITLSGQGTFSKLRSFFGAKEIEVEDRAFNDRWFIETSDPEFLKVALYGKICAAIDASQPAGTKPKGRYKMEVGAVRYEEQGTLGDADRRERIRLAIPAAQQLLDVASVHADQGGSAAESRVRDS
jgi:hypothetical protein